MQNINNIKQNCEAIVYSNTLKNDLHRNNQELDKIKSAQEICSSVIKYVKSQNCSKIEIKAKLDQDQEGFFLLETYDSGNKKFLKIGCRFSITFFKFPDKETVIYKQTIPMDIEETYADVALEVMKSVKNTIKRLIRAETGIEFYNTAIEKLSKINPKEYLSHHQFPYEVKFKKDAILFEVQARSLENTLVTLTKTASKINERWEKCTSNETERLWISKVKIKVNGKVFQPIITSPKEPPKLESKEVKNLDKLPITKLDDLDEDFINNKTDTEESDDEKYETPIYEILSKEDQSLEKESKKDLLDTKKDYLSDDFSVSGDEGGNLSDKDFVDIQEAVIKDEKVNYIELYSKRIPELKSKTKDTRFKSRFDDFEEALHSKNAIEAEEVAKLLQQLSDEEIIGNNHKYLPFVEIIFFEDFEMSKKIGSFLLNHKDQINLKSSYLELTEGEVSKDFEKEFGDYINVQELNQVYNKKDQIIKYQKKLQKDVLEDWINSGDAQKQENEEKLNNAKKTLSGFDNWDFRHTNINQALFNLAQSNSCEKELRSIISLIKDEYYLLNATKFYTLPPIPYLFFMILHRYSAHSIDNDEKVKGILNEVGKSIYQYLKNNKNIDIDCPLEQLPNLDSIAPEGQPGFIEFKMYRDLNKHKCGQLLPIIDLFLKGDENNIKSWSMKGDKVTVELKESIEYRKQKEDPFKDLDWFSRNALESYLGKIIDGRLILPKLVEFTIDQDHKSLKFGEKCKPVMEINWATIEKPEWCSLKNVISITINDQKVDCVLEDGKDFKTFKSIARWGFNRKFNELSKGYDYETMLNDIDAYKKNQKEKDQKKE